MRLLCHGCGQPNDLNLPIGRRDLCDGCGAELRCCLQCELHDPASGRCREPMAEVPREKDRANFCEHFTPGSPRTTGPDSAEAARSAFDALFKK